MSSIQWPAVRDALQSWVVTGSGFAGDHVIWYGQRDAAGNPLPRPSGPYISLMLKNIRWKGPADITRYEYNAGSNTYTQVTNGPRLVDFVITCYQGVQVGMQGAPDVAPMAVLNDVMTMSGVGNVDDALVAAGIGIGDIDQLEVQGNPINNVQFEARAIGTVKLNLASEVRFDLPVGTGWIQFVNGDGNTGTDAQGVHVRVVT